MEDMLKSSHDNQHDPPQPLETNTENRTWIERATRKLAVGVRFPSSYLGIGLAGGWLGWMLGALRDIDITVIHHLLAPKLLFDYGEILGAIISLILVVYYKKLSSLGGLVAASTACAVLGSLYVILVNTAVVSPPALLTLTVALASGIGYIILSLSWLEALGFISPVKAMFAYAVSYLVNSAIWFCLQGIAPVVTNIVALILPIGSFLLLMIVLGRAESPTRESMNATGNPSINRILLWIWVFALAYGVGGAFTQMSYSTVASKLGTALPALAVVLGLLLTSKRLDYSVFYRSAFILMIVGFILSLITISHPVLVQAFMSAGNCLVTIMVITYSCGAAYFRKSSSLIMLAPVYIGWFALALFGRHFSQFAINYWSFPVSTGIIVACVVIVALLMVALFWFREIDFLTYWKDIQRNTEQKDPALPPIVQARFATLSNREMTVLTLLAAGYQQDDIAKELFIAPGTVRSHINHIYTKLGIHSKEELQQLLTDVSIE